MAAKSCVASISLSGAGMGVLTGKIADTIIAAAFRATPLKQCRKLKPNQPLIKGANMISLPFLFVFLPFLALSLMIILSGKS